MMFLRLFKRQWREVNSVAAFDQNHIDRMIRSVFLKLALLALVIGFSTAFVRRSTASHTRSFSIHSMSESLSASLNPAETAVVFIEYQNEFASPGGKLHDAVKDCMMNTNMLSNSAAFAVSARAAGCTIIHCPINFEPVRTC